MKSILKIFCLFKEVLLGSYAMYKASHVNVSAEDGYLIHRSSTIMPEFNRDYGLWLFGSIQYGEISPHSPPKFRYFRFYGISQAVEGGGVYYTKRGGKTKVNTGDFVITTPGFLQDYAPVDGKYIEDSICFTGVVADNLAKCGVIKDGVFSMGQGRLLMPIIEQLSNPSKEVQMKVNLSLIRLLTEIFLSNSSLGSSKQYTQVDYLIELINLNPEKWWTIDEMVNICSLSASQLRTIFFKKTGMNPKLYIDKLKMNKASSLLLHSTLSVATIAKTVGYSDAYHFSRRFKQVLGVSPARYRALYFSDIVVPSEPVETL